jgi:hypothetical protein
MDHISDTPTEQYDDISEDSLPVSEKKGILLFVLGTIFSIIIIVGVVALGIIYFKSFEVKKVVEVVTSEIQVPSVTPEITILKNNEITFEIINATGIAGTATKYKDVLEGKGYKVNSVAMADKKEKGISVFMVKGLENQKDALLSEIKKDFTTVNYSGELTDSVNMVKLVVGY